MDVQNQTNPLHLESRKAQDTTGLHRKSVQSGKTTGETVASSRVLRDKSRWGRWAARTEKRLHHTCGEAGSLGPRRPETHPRNSSKGTCYRVKKTDTRQFLQTLPKLTDVQFSHSVVSNSLRPHEPQHARPPCPSLTLRVHPNQCPLSQWSHPTIVSSVVPFSSCPQSFPALGSFPMSELFASGGQSIGVSASTSVLPMNTQDWSPSGLTGWISLQSKGLSRVFSNTTVQKHQFFGTQLSL